MGEKVNVYGRKVNVYGMDTGKSYESSVHEDKNGYFWVKGNRVQARRSPPSAVQGGVRVACQSGVSSRE